MTLQNCLCSRFCAYYKPEKAEGLACRGFVFVDRMIRAGREITFERSGVSVGSWTADSLTEALCRSCPFFARDCDFAAGREAPPCGGYLLIGQLLEARTVSVDDLLNMD
jgi:hypothetical protein